MSGTTVRIREDTREQLRVLEEKTGCRTPDLLARAVDQFRRSFILAETNVAYGALTQNAAAWSDEDDERELWDATLSDGLEDETEAS
jgi:hypothetical protein